MKKLHLLLSLLGLALFALAVSACGRSPELPASPANRATPSGAAARGLPAGFQLGVFAEGLAGARFMSFAPDGTLYVGSTNRAGTVWALPDRNHDGKADEVIVFADGLRSPHSVAWRDGWLYVGETHRVIRLRDTDGDLRSDQQEVVVAELPPGGQHSTRTVGFGPDGPPATDSRRAGALYVSVGSSCNVCKEDDPRRAAILRFNADGPPATDSRRAGTGREIYARGLRNAVGFTWHPQTKEMWATDNGRDWLGDELPPEELDLVRAGDDHGWPYCYGNRIPDPDLGSAERCARTQPATFEMQAHSAPLGLAFYTGEQFPQEYRGDLFIAFHGSWNRSVPTGYKVVRVRFRDGRPVGIEDFVDVWLKGGRVTHRPVDVKTGPDGPPATDSRRAGALYISDDRGGTIFRLTYRE